MGSDVREIHGTTGWAQGHRLVTWEGAPAASGIFAPEELFEVFLTVREDPRGVGVIFFNYEVEENVFHRQGSAPTPPEHMPSRADATFAGHRERVKSELRGAHYCLRVTEPQAYSAAIFERLVERFAVLSPALERESRAIRTTAFVGDYAYTPFGVHVDPYPQIQCAVSGARTAFFWDDAYWVGRTEADRMAPWKHLQAAHEVAIPAGNAIYWAGDYEHAFSSGGEGDAATREGPSIALTVSFPEIPPADSEVERIRRRSARHFLNAPLARAARSFSADHAFSGSALFPVTMTSSNDGEAIVIGAGRTFTMPCVPGLAALVARVNERRPFRLRDCEELDEGDARVILELLYAHYCVDALDAPRR